MKPELRSFGSLTAADLERAPVWLACHVTDYDEEWHEDTDEETFRPWTGELPLEPTDGTYLVKATATIANGLSFPGFLTPAVEDDLGIVQPHVFVRGRTFSFWGGMVETSRQQPDEFYAAVGTVAEAVLPIRFTVAPGLVKGATVTEVRGFYRTRGSEATVVER